MIDNLMVQDIPIWALIESSGPKMTPILEAVQRLENSDMPWRASEPRPYDKICGCGELPTSTDDPFAPAASLLAIPATGMDVLWFAASNVPTSPPVPVPFSVTVLLLGVGFIARGYLIGLERPLDPDVADNPNNPYIELSGLPAWPPPVG